jgi:hypothetical protein
MKVKGPVACLLATLISVLATVTVAADTDTDSSVTAAHGLRVSKAKEENRALQDGPQLSDLRKDLKALKGEARAAALAVKMKQREMDRAKFDKDLDTVWEECPRFGPTSEHSCDPITLTSKCPFYGKTCQGVDGTCKRNRHCECDAAGKFSCTQQEGTCIPCELLTKKKCEALLNCDLEGNRGIPVDPNGPSIRDITVGLKFKNTLDEEALKYGNEVGCWDVSQVTNMDHGFFQRRGFNKPLCWDVSKVTSMQGMFYDARFDQDISFWDVSSVMNLDNSMFRLNTLDPDDVRAYFNLEDDDEDEDTEGL